MVLSLVHNGEIVLTGQSAPTNALELRWNFDDREAYVPSLFRNSLCVNPNKVSAHRFASAINGEEESKSSPNSKQMHVNEPVIS